MDEDVFYWGCAANLKAGQALEEGHLTFACLGHDMLHDICAHHSLPEDWVMFGMVDEIAI